MARLGPDLFQDADIFVGAFIAFLFRQRVAVAELLGIIASGNHVDRRSSIGDLIQGCELARRQCWRNVAGPMGHQKAQPLGMCRRSGGEQEPVGPIRKIPHQDPIEPPASAAWANSRI